MTELRQMLKHSFTMPFIQFTYNIERVYAICPRLARMMQGAKRMAERFFSAHPLRNLSPQQD